MTFIKICNGILWYKCPFRKTAKSCRNVVPKFGGNQEELKQMKGLKVIKTNQVRVSGVILQLVTYLKGQGHAYHSTTLLIENKTQNKTTMPHPTEKQPRWCPLGQGGLLSHTAPPNPVQCSCQAKLWCSLWDACVHQAVPDTQGGSGSLGRSRS